MSAPPCYVLLLLALQWSWRDAGDFARPLSAATTLRLLLLPTLLAAARTKDAPPLPCGTSVGTELTCFQEGGGGLRWLADGERIELPCASPEGSTQWRRLGPSAGDPSPSSPSSPSFQATQAGLYQCILRLAQGDVVLREVEIRALPSPSSRTLDVPFGANAALSCLSEGHFAPATSTQWTQNYQDLPSIHPTRFLQLSSGTLHLLDVDSRTTGNFTCRTEGVEYSVDVRVIETVPGDGLAQAPRNLTLSAGQSGELECLPNSGHDVAWRRLDGAAIRGTRLGPNLRFAAAQVADEGWYACRVDGKDERAFLRVAVAPRILQPPLTLARRRGKTARFSCDSAAHPKPNITWLFNSEPITPLGRFKTFSSPSEGGLWTRDLVISSVQPGDAGVYQCVAVNSAGSATAAALLLYDAEPSEMAAPTDLKASLDRTAGQIRLEWRAPLGANHSLYIVHFFAAGGVTNTQPATCDTTFCRSACCPNVQLRPATNYTFFVSALSRGGQFSPPSNEIRAETWDGVTRGSAALRLDQLSASAVRLAWEVPTDLPGRLTGWLVQTRLDGAPIRTQTRPALVRELALSGLPPGSELEARVLAETRAGTPADVFLLNKDAYPWTHLKLDSSSETQEHRRPPAPLLDLRRIGATSLSVTLRADEDSPPLTFFALRVRPVEPTTGPSQQHNVSLDDSPFEVTGLQPNTTYEVEARSVSTAAVYGLEIVEIVRTKATEKDGSGTLGEVAGETPTPPQHLWCESTESGLRLHWLPAEAAQYRVRYSPLSDSQAYSDMFLTETASVELPLMSGVWWVTVASVSRSGRLSPPSPGVECGWEASAVKLKATTLNATAARVSWSGAAPSELLWAPFEQSVKDWARLGVVGRSGATVGDLKPASVYLFKLSFPDGRESELAATQTDETTKIKVERSYKEGVIVGVCLSLLILLLCCGLLVHRRKHLLHGGPIRRRLRVFFTGSSLSHSSSNGSRKTEAVVNGVGRTSVVETQEMLTLLQPLEENAAADSKGGEGGFAPRHRLLSTSRRLSQPVVEAEASSDLSASPASSPAPVAPDDDSLESVEEEPRLCPRRAGGLGPHLADSGVCFDESRLTLPA